MQCQGCCTWLQNTFLGSSVHYLASHYIDAERRSLFFSFLQNTLMVRVWKVCNWTEVHDRMKEGERIYSDKFPIANVTGTW